MEGLGFICVLLLVAGVYGEEEAASCSVSIAETCITEREIQFEMASTVYKAHTNISPDLKNLCMTQLRIDNVGKCFEAWTELCTEEEGRAIRQKWEDLNSKIINLCQQVCPNIKEIPNCKAMVHTDEIQDSKFERFCLTFNESMQCAVEQLNDCSFGMSMYTDIIAPTFLGYWNYICKSGCHNIDETVLLIRDCFSELKKATKENLCEYQAEFNRCVFDNPVVCPEVVKLVVFRYRAYNRVEKMCKPVIVEPASTTVTTTIKTTEKTTVSTSTSTDGQTQSLSIELTTAQEAVSGVSRENLARNDTNATTPPPTTTTTATEATTTKMMTYTSDCITEEEIDLFTQSQDTSMDKIMLVLKFESCIHNKTNDLDELRNIMAVMPTNFLQAYHQAKRESWSVVQAAAPSCSEGEEGCSGHQYGYISCKSGSPKLTESRILQSFLMALSVWRLTLELISYF